MYSSAHEVIKVLLFFTVHGGLFIYLFILPCPIIIIPPFDRGKKTV